jgi:hypothetical protein
MDRMSFFAELVGLRGDKAALALSDAWRSRATSTSWPQACKNTGGYAEKVAKIQNGDDDGLLEAPDVDGRGA